MSSYDSPPEEGPEPEERDYEEAKEELESGEWFEEQVDALQQDGLSEDSAEMRVRKSEAYKKRHTELAYDAMEARFEQWEMDAEESRSGVEE